MRRPRSSTVLVCILCVLLAGACHIGLRAPQPTEPSTAVGFNFTPMPAPQPQPTTGKSSSSGPSSAANGAIVLLAGACFVLFLVAVSASSFADGWQSD